MDRFISFETALKLKEAGLTWDTPKQGDPFYWRDIIEDWYIDVLSFDDVNSHMEDVLDNIDEWIYAPDIFLMIKEIKKYGYSIRLEWFEDNSPRVLIFKGSNEFNFESWSFGDINLAKAVANTLLWVLENKKGDK